MIQELFKIRNELYDAIPVKNVETWELLKIIKNHLAKLDALMEANKISSNLPVIGSVPVSKVGEMDDAQTRVDRGEDGWG